MHAARELLYHGCSNNCEILNVCLFSGSFTCLSMRNFKARYILKMLTVEWIMDQNLCFRASSACRVLLTVKCSRSFSGHSVHLGFLTTLINRILKMAHHRANGVKFGTLGHLVKHIWVPYTLQWSVSFGVIQCICLKMVWWNNILMCSFVLHVSNTYCSYHADIKVNGPLVSTFWQVP